MVRKVLKKLFRHSSKEPEPDKRIGDVRADAHDKASELNPGHSDQAAQIGMFS